MIKNQLPAPSPDLERYNATIQKGFELFPDRQANFERFKQSTKQPDIDYMPLKIDIENISRCNLKCPMCPASLRDENSYQGVLDFQLFQKILNEQIGVYEMKIQGVGEPFLDKNFIKMVEYASNREIWTRSTTNGTIIDRNENYKKVVDAGIGEIQVSFDGATKETYESIRINSDFDKVVENATLLNQYCSKLNMDVTRMWSLISSDNIHECTQLPAIAAKMGFKRLTFSIGLHNWGYETLENRNNDKNFDTEKQNELFQQAIEIANKLGVELTFWQVNSSYSENNICSWPFERLFISSKGEILPCCIAPNPEKAVIGHYDDFNEIWFGAKYRQFRLAHLQMDIPEICLSCYDM